jgi:hypothetical protein
MKINAQNFVSKEDLILERKVKTRVVAILY